MVKKKKDRKKTHSHASHLTQNKMQKLPSQGHTTTWPWMHVSPYLPAPSPFSSALATFTTVSVLFLPFHNHRASSHLRVLVLSLPTEHSGSCPLTFPLSMSLLGEGSTLTSVSAVASPTILSTQPALPFPRAHRSAATCTTPRASSKQRPTYLLIIIYQWHIKLASCSYSAFCSPLLINVQS